MYLLLLTVIPCCAMDSDSRIIYSFNHISQVAANTHENGCADTSPIAGCHHCAVFSIPEPPADFLDAQEFGSATQFALPADQFISSIYSKVIWQPPDMCC